MSNSRILDVLSNPTSRDQQFSFRLFCKIAWLFLLTQMQRASSLAQEMDPTEFQAFHLASDAWYQIFYSEESPFSLLPLALDSDCKMLTGTPPNPVEYENAVNFTCSWNNQPIGPTTVFNLETNRTFAKEVVECLDTVMRRLCDMYNDDHHHRPIPNPQPDPSELDMWPYFLAIAGITLFACGVGCIASCVCSSNRPATRNDIEAAPLSTSSHYHHHHHDSGSGVGAAIATLGLLGSLASVNSSYGSSHSARGGYQADSSSGISGAIAHFAKPPGR